MGMRVRTLATVTTPAGIVPPGVIITIPDTVLDRLSGKVEIIPTPEPTEICRCCGGTDIWQGRGKRVCRVCHPPAPGAEIITSHRAEGQPR